MKKGVAPASRWPWASRQDASATGFLKAEVTKDDWKALQLNPGDNVAVSLEDIPAHALVVILGGQAGTVSASQAIPFAHKLAIKFIAKGEAIIKHGARIGFATCGISAGEWVHEHNVQSYLAAKSQEVAQ